MKKILQFSVLLLSISCIKAQTVTPNVIASDGGSFTSAQGIIDWTIGEPVSETNSNSGNVTTNGFHQPILELVTLITEQSNAQQVLVYPNPVKENLNVSFVGIPFGPYKINMVDALGKLIIASEIIISEKSNLFQLKVEEYAAGAYLLNIEGKDFSKIVKINKVN